MCWGIYIVPAKTRVGAGVKQILEDDARGEMWIAARIYTKCQRARERRPRDSSSCTNGMGQWIRVSQTPRLLGTGLKTRERGGGRGHATLGQGVERNPRYILATSQDGPDARARARLFICGRPVESLVLEKGEKEPASCHAMWGKMCNRGKSRATINVRCPFYFLVQFRPAFSVFTPANSERNWAATAASASPLWNCQTLLAALLCSTLLCPAHSLTAPARVLF